jgi:hypothetical protein
MARFQIIYTERGSDRSESNLDTYPTKPLAEQAARDAFAKLALRWNLAVALFLWSQKCTDRNN